MALTVVKPSGIDTTGNYTVNGMTISANANIANISANGVVNFTNSSNVSLGAVGNIKITGGTANYVLSTDGAGNLSWVEQTGGTGGGGTGTTIVDSFSGNGVRTTFTLSTTPANINLTTVNYDGVVLLKSDYTLSGSNITLSNAPANGSNIEITTTSPSSSGTNPQDLLSPFLLMGA